MAGITNEVMKQTAVNVRAQAYAMALDTISRTNGQQLTVDKIVEEAKKVEKFLWGMLAPIEHMVNPFSSINAAACATRDRIQEFADGQADPEIAKKIVAAGAHWERFMSEMSEALGDKFDA